MSLSPPLGLTITVVRWLGSLATKKLFLNTYRRSHELWAHDHRLGAYWEKCGDHLEYSLHLAQHTDPEPQVSKIAFRAKSEEVTHLSLIFEAESYTARFQEQVSLDYVNHKAIVWTMTNIPCQRFFRLHDGVGIRFSWDTLKLRDIRITLQSGRELTPFDMLTSSLTHSWFLNSKWKFKWGQYWNLDAIYCAKQTLVEYWRFSFGMPRVRIFRPYDSSDGTITLAQAVAVVTRPIAWAMSKEFVITIQFWFALWSGLCQLNDESQLQWCWRKREELTDLNENT